MTVGVWMVPLVLLAAAALLWASAWLEGYLAPRDDDRVPPAMDGVDIAFVDTASDHASLDTDDYLAAEPLSGTSLAGRTD